MEKKIETVTQPSSTSTTRYYLAVLVILGTCLFTVFPDVVNDMDRSIKTIVELMLTR